MSRYIVKIRDRYLEWSTVVDAPVTYGMTLEAFREYYLEEHGPDSERYFEEFIKRADQNGASDDYHWHRYNRAGPHEVFLNKDELYQVYCLRQPLSEETIQQKVAAMEAELEQRRRVIPLPPNPSDSDIRATYESLALGTSLEKVQSILGAGENTTRKRGSQLRYRWVFDSLVLICQFDKKSRALNSRNLTPNWSAIE